MDWLHETHRKIYVRVDGKWLRHPLSTRSLASDLIKYVDDDGCLYLAHGESPQEAVFRITQAQKHERKRVFEDVENLIRDLPDDPAFLTWEKADGRLRMRNFAAAQGLYPTSSEERSKARSQAAVRAAAWRSRRNQERDDDVREPFANAFANAEPNAANAFENGPERRSGTHRVPARADARTSRARGSVPFQEDTKEEINISHLSPAYLTRRDFGGAK